MLMEFVVFRKVTLDSCTARPLDRWNRFSQFHELPFQQKKLRLSRTFAKLHKIKYSFENAESKNFNVIIVN